MERTKALPKEQKKALVDDRFSDHTTERYKRTLEYALTKSQPFQYKITKYHTSEDSDYGLTKTMEIQSCVCPCSVCGHEYMWECDDANCACCSSACC